ncbi:MAG TPA: nucleotide sugar dehydrogenase [Candidatus Binatia bacterium]|nr:nucleotide sugar dehydrogenase [Candidatus Binatia bacterium]
MKTNLPRCVAVVGLGYVGLPLASAFGKVVSTIGFDINEQRVRELRKGTDRNGEVSKTDLREPLLELSSDPSLLQRAAVIIIAVPTPVDKAKRPDLSHLIDASRLVAQNLARGATVVYESTVYPGCTEEICVPVLEAESGLKAGRDFKVGYSPERINPGDHEHALNKVMKIVAGQDDETTEKLAAVYGMVVEAGVYKAPTIRTAEAAKVIENVQRDLNIALMNELAVLFHRMGLDTLEVLKAARSKWNFLGYEPGLVGGHCIPVDPYYLTFKAQELDHHPDVILAGRRINDYMGHYIAQETVKLLILAGRVVRGASALILGATFKENVNDLRNTRVAEVVQELENHGVEVAVYDPLVAPGEIQKLNMRPLKNPFEAKEKFDAVVLAVPHRMFLDMPPESYTGLLRNGGKPAVFVDIKGAYRDAGNKSGVMYWSL